MTRDFTNTRAALKVFDAGKSARDRAWEDAESNADVLAAEKADADALTLLREAYWQDTNDINSRDHRADERFMRMMADSELNQTEVSK
jgi:hypothetical protein